MRDGVRLATDIYFPEGDGPFPVILLRSPYDRKLGEGIAQDAARRGYVMVVQNTRGRFGSEGENLPFETDGWGRLRDGEDTVEWIARQPWCNGKIGTWGGSALGITQYLLAGTGTKRVTAQNITVGAPSLYHGVVYWGGVFRKAMIEDWLRISAFSPDALKIWTSHPTYDSYWRERDMTTRFRYTNAPAIHIGGWYDIFAQATTCLRWNANTRRTRRTRQAETADRTLDAWGVSRESRGTHLPQCQEPTHNRTRHLEVV